MRRVTAVILLSAALGLSGVSAQGFLWRTEKMTAEVREPQGGGARHFLLLTQELEPGEQGWTKMKLDLPAHWKVDRLTVAGGKVTLVTAAHGRDELTAENTPQLDFEILDGGVKPDSELEQLWRKHAAAKP